MDSVRLILASASPRRAEILRMAGIDFLVRPAAVDERRLDGECAADYVQRLARAKALAIDCAEPIVAADTTVVVDHHILEKPADARDAARMLQLLSGRNHQVLTGVCLRLPTCLRLACEVTTVHFQPLTPDDIASYVATGEPMDKAGAYAIQGLASRFVDRIEGCYFNVVGLPVARLWRMLREACLC